MAKRLDDEDRRPGDEDQDEDRRVSARVRHPELEAAEFEAEQPAAGRPAALQLVVVEHRLAGRGDRDQAEAWPLWRLEPAASPSLASLPLVAAEVGRRTLVVGDRRLPLYASGGAPAHLVLTVRR
jgi:hypothetical protein